MSALEELLQNCENMHGDVMASFTDMNGEFKWPEDKEALLKKEKNLLELRIFNAEVEHKLFRSSIGREFQYRRRDDSNLDTMDEVQLLKGKNEAVRIRYYMKMSEHSGQAEVVDWRLVSFEEVQ